MIDRRSMLAMGAGAAFAPRAAQAAGGSSDRRYRIYMITYRGRTDVERGFEDYLAARKVPVDLIHRDADRDIGRVAGFVEEIKETRPDLVYTWGTPVTLAVAGPYDAADRARYVTDIPVVFTLVAAPVQAKVVPSLASSKRNVTGAFHVVPPATQIRAIQSYRPFDVLGELYTPTEQNSLVLVEELRRLGPDMGFRLVERRFAIGANGEPSADGYEKLLAEIKQEGATWLYLLPDTFFGTICDIVTPTALDLGLPGFASTELAIRQCGALAGLICRYYSIGQLTASMAEQILVQHVPPADIPIQTLKRFSLIININVARRLQLYPPLAMLNYAEIIRG
jgi:putative ABC transport system substrate-binding protein